MYTCLWLQYVYMSLVTGYSLLSWRTLAWTTTLAIFQTCSVFWHTAVAHKPASVPAALSLGKRNNVG